MLSATIIICARNAADHLIRSIPAALRQDYPEGRFKVLVVDNGSTDETALVARNFGVVVKSYAKPGVAGARQFGWKVSRSEIVAYLDADCEPPADWLRRMVELLEANSRLAAVGPKLVPGETRTLAEEHIARSGILDTDRFWSRNALQWPFLATAGMVVRRAALEAVDGFDLSFGRKTGEDADLCWRLERAGWEVRYEAGLEIIHHHRATIPAMLRQANWYGRSSAALFAKWRTELGWWRFTDWAPYRRIGQGLIFALPALVLGQSNYDRFKPSLEALDAIAFLAGKWRGAIEQRVLFF